jgi:hypothetical protein
MITISVPVLPQFKARRAVEMNKTQSLSHLRVCLGNRELKISLWRWLKYAGGIRMHLKPLQPLLYIAFSSQVPYFITHSPIFAEILSRAHCKHVLVACLLHQWRLPCFWLFVGSGHPPRLRLVQYLEQVRLLGGTILQTTSYCISTNLLGVKFIFSLIQLNTNRAYFI